jgi:hypothetical protein
MPFFEPPGPQGHAPGLGDGQCAIHPQLAAVGTCQRCGNYLCRVCRSRWRNQMLCIACVDRALDTREKSPEEARTHRRQAILALVFGLASWLIVGIALLVFVIVDSALPADDMVSRGLMLIVLAVVALASPLLSIAGVGQAAAAIRTRGDHMILATAGLLLSALHIGLLIGHFFSNIWRG